MASCKAFAVTEFSDNVCVCMRLLHDTRGITLVSPPIEGRQQSLPRSFRSILLTQRANPKSSLFFSHANWHHPQKHTDTTFPFLANTCFLKCWSKLSAKSAVPSSSLFELHLSDKVSICIAPWRVSSQAMIFLSCS